MEYTVKSPLKWKGKRQDIGKSVEMDEKTAAPLVEQGVLEATSEKKASGKDQK